MQLRIIRCQIQLRVRRLALKPGLSSVMILTQRTNGSVSNISKLRRLRLLNDIIHVHAQVCILLTIWNFYNVLQSLQHLSETAFLENRTQTSQEEYNYVALLHSKSPKSAAKIGSQIKL